MTLVKCEMSSVFDLPLLVKKQPPRTSSIQTDIASGELYAVVHQYDRHKRVNLDPCCLNLYHHLSGIEALKSMQVKDILLARYISDEDEASDPENLHPSYIDGP